MTKLLDACIGVVVVTAMVVLSLQFIEGQVSNADVQIYALLSLLFIRQVAKDYE